MKVLILDIYPNVDYRISKDQNGGFGTANDYGKTFFTKFLKKFVNKSISFPPLYSVQVIGELKKLGHQVEFTNKMPSKNNDYDFYIITSSIVCHETEIDAIKKLKTDKKTIFAIGPFATSVPDNYVEAGAKVVNGEPEMFFHNFDYDKESMGKLPDIIKEFEIFDVNDLAIPGWEEIFKVYVPKMKFLGSGPAVNINASRGCPYSCYYYCVYPLQQGRKLRVKSPDKLIEEIKYLNKVLNVKNFVFRDPVFSINRKHTIEICEMLINENLNIRICIETHLKNLDDELSSLLKKAGVKLVYVGIESADEEVRVNSNRASEDNDKQISKINYLEKIGINVKAMYIVGLPTDNKISFQKTVEYAKKINSLYAQISVFTPYPGTPAFNEYKDKLITNKYEDFTQWKLVFKHPNFDTLGLDKILSKSYQQYYLRPSWIFRYIKHRLFG